MSAVSSLPNPPAAYLRFENSADALEPPPPPAPGAQFEVFGHPWNHDDIPGTPAPKRARVAGDDDLPTELKRCVLSTSDAHLHPSRVCNDLTHHLPPARAHAALISPDDRINRKMRQVVLDFLAAASESKKTADYQCVGTVSAW